MFPPRAGHSGGGPGPADKCCSHVLRRSTGIDPTGFRCCGAEARSAPSSASAVVQLARLVVEVKPVGQPFDGPFALPVAQLAYQINYPAANVRAGRAEETVARHIQVERRRL